MDTSAELNKSIKLRAAGFVRRIVVLAVLGIVSIILCMILFASKSSIIFVAVFFVSIALVWFCVPILGLNAIIYMVKRWTALTEYGDKEEEKQICKISGNLLVIAFLLAVISFFPILFIGIFGDGTILRFLWSLVIVITGFVMACISFKLYQKTSCFLLERIVAVFSAVICFAVMVFLLLSSSYFGYLVQQYEYSKKVETFSGKSDSLKQTVIVPTLDIPLEENKNVIWCSPFQLAWNQIKNDIIGQTKQVVEAEKLETSPNSAKQSSQNLEPESFYIAAGRIKEGIINKIQKDMAAKFPSHTLPEFNRNNTEAIMVYSYLNANVQFKYPFCKYEKDFYFTDSTGVKTKINAFGTWEFLKYSYIREQVEILYCNRDNNKPELNKQINEFVIDLCKYSQPNQFVVAVVEPKRTLQKTLAYIDALIKEYKNNEKNKPDLEIFDALLIPEMFWEIDHRFNELPVQFIANINPAISIAEARQEIKFRLDRNGAVLERKFNPKKSDMSYFEFNQPFLIYMKKRDCEQPFFVMWVDNAELLTKK